MRRLVPKDVELWVPRPFTEKKRVTMQHRIPGEDPYCILLTTKHMTALGLRMIRLAAELEALMKERPYG